MSDEIWTIYILRDPRGAGEPRQPAAVPSVHRQPARRLANRGESATFATGAIRSRLHPERMTTMMHPDDIGHARAEARQQAAEDGVMLVDEDDDWYDLAGMDLEDQLEALLDAEQEAIRAEVNADLDALHAEAARYRAAGIDPQLAMWMARHRQG